MEERIGSKNSIVQNSVTIVPTIKTLFFVTVGILMMISIITTPIFYVGIIIASAELTGIILGTKVIGMFAGGIFGFIYYVFIFGFVLK